MLYNGLFYEIRDDADFEKMKKGIDEKKKEMNSLKKKWFKTSKINLQIQNIEKDIEGAELACVEYLERERKRKKILSASVFELKTSVSGTSFRIPNVKKAVKHIYDDSGLSAFDGLKNEEIEEEGYDRVYKYDSLFTRDFNLTREPDNEYDKNAIKVTVEEFHIGYLPKDIALKLAPILDSTDYQIEAMLIIKGGPYKTFDYEKDKVITIDSNYGFDINGLVVDKNKL